MDGECWLRPEVKTGGDLGGVLAGEAVLIRMPCTSASRVSTRAYLKICGKGLKTLLCYFIGHRKRNMVGSIKEKELKQ